MTREEAIKIIEVIDRRYMTLDNDERNALKMAIKALEQEPCEDEYIKVPKKALKYRTAGMVAYNAEWLKNHFDIERLVICGAQQTCEDSISRQAVLDIIDSDWKYEGMEQYINDLPPVKPQEQKTGHWIRYKENCCYNKCSICEYEHCKESNYCPNC